MGFGGNNPVLINYGLPNSLPGAIQRFTQPTMAQPVNVNLTTVIGTLRNRAEVALRSIQNYVGKRVSFAAVLRLVRRLSPFLSIAAIAASIGVTETELQDILAYSTTKKRRRMNPLNLKALTKAQRRLCSFENRVKKVYQFNKTSRIRKPKKRTC